LDVYVGLCVCLFGVLGFDSCFVLVVSLCAYLSQIGKVLIRNEVSNQSAYLVIF
jgi:hypothetical protein